MRRLIVVLVLVVAGCSGGPRGTRDAGPGDSGPVELDAGPPPPVPVCDVDRVICPEGYRDACDSPRVSGLPTWRCAQPTQGPTCTLDGNGFDPLCIDGVPTCDDGETPVCVPPDPSIGCPGRSCF